ncbi:minichromosome maintenance protein MCM [Candidatus Undinarchaeota archaeon]
MEREESLTSRFEEIFKRQALKKRVLEVAKEYPEKKSVIMSYSELEKYDADIADRILNEPDTVLKAAEDAIKDMKLPIDEDEWHIYFRVSDLPEESKVWVRNLRSLHLGKLISLEGIVRTASDVRPQAVSIEFECPACGNGEWLAQETTTIAEPYACNECGRKGKFKQLGKKLIDATNVRIQEPPDAILGSEQPAVLMIDLRDDLIAPEERKKILPGNTITVTGILKEFAAKQASTRYDIFMQAIHVEASEQEYSEIDLNKADIKEIKAIAADVDIYNKLIDSISPSIYGHREVKEAILLQLFGGVRKIQPDGTKIRGDIHMLLIGDPGVGKSQMMRYVADLAPKGRYVSGKGASAAGLTATAVRDEQTGGWMLEAGALVLANMGSICIDEFEKMGREDRGAIHEALEQQKISIAKAGIVTTLSARASVLAAANPKYGRFDVYRSISEQIDLDVALLSRFDLKFPIMDKPSKEADTALAEHILKSYTDRTSIEPTFEPEFLRKYIAYAKQESEPKLTKEAAKLIKDFYVEWRTRYAEDDGTVSLTPRQLEAISRMSEASARIRLDDKVRPEDVQRATRLLESSLRQLGTDKDTGKIDIDRIETGISSAQRSRIHVVFDILTELEEKLGKRIPMDEIFREAKERGIDQRDMESLVSKLKEKGDLFEPQPGYVQKA